MSGRFGHSRKTVVVGGDEPSYVAEALRQFAELERTSKMRGRDLRVSSHDRAISNGFSAAMYAASMILRNLRDGGKASNLVGTTERDRPNTLRDRPNTA